MASKGTGEPKKKRGRGRPPMEPGRAKRSSFNTRIRPGLKSDLEREAATSGRSLSEEIEFRLEQSFLQEAADQREQRSIEEAFGGAGRFRFLRIISGAADQIEWAKKGKRVDQDPNSWAAFRDATMRLFDEFAPARKRPLLGLLGDAEIEENKVLGQNAARLVIAATKIILYRDALKKKGVDPDSVAPIESE